MSAPGFTGTASLYRSSGQYQTSRKFTQTQMGVITPALNWGKMSYSCTGNPGVGKYSSILWGIPWGQSWEQACHTTPAPSDDPTIAGRLPDNCVTGLNEWGEWYMTDHSCCVTQCVSGYVCDSFNNSDDCDADCSQKDGSCYGNDIDGYQCCYTDPCANQ